MNSLLAERFDPVRASFGLSPRCRICGEVPKRIEYARNLLTRRVIVVVACAGHHVQRELDVERIAADCARAHMLSAIVTEFRRVFDDVLVPATEAEPTTTATEIIRRAIVCGACGAPSNPNDPTCVYCKAHLAAVLAP